MSSSTAAASASADPTMNTNAPVDSVAALDAASALPASYDLLLPLQNPLLYSLAPGSAPATEPLSTVALPLTLSPADALPPLSDLHALLSQGVSASLCHALALEYHKRGHGAAFQQLVQHAQTVPVQTAADSLAQVKLLTAQAGAAMAQALALPVRDRTVAASSATQVRSYTRRPRFMHPCCFNANLSHI